MFLNLSGYFKLFDSGEKLKFKVEKEKKTKVEKKKRNFSKCNALSESCTEIQLFKKLQISLMLPFWKDFFYLKYSILGIPRLNSDG